VPTATDDVVLSTSTGYIIVTLSSGQTANFRTLTVGGGGGFASLYLVGNIGSGQDIPCFYDTFCENEWIKKYFWGLCRRELQCRDILEGDSYFLCFLFFVRVSLYLT
jgi:hypothetical protein